MSTYQGLSARYLFVTKHRNHLDLNRSPKLNPCMHFEDYQAIGDMTLEESRQMHSQSQFISLLLAIQLPSCNPQGNNYLPYLAIVEIAYWHVLA